MHLVRKDNAPGEEGAGDGREQVQTKRLRDGRGRWEEAPLRAAASGIPHCRRVERRRHAQGEGAARLCIAPPGRRSAGRLPSGPPPGMPRVTHVFSFPFSLSF